MNFSTINDRRRYFVPIHTNIANYCTDSMQKKELQRDFGEELFLNNLHLIPDPLKKNLADTIITAQSPKKKVPEPVTIPKMPEDPQINNSAFSGIYNFFSGVFHSLSGAIFRPKSPVYYDCFTPDGNWQASSTEKDIFGKNESSTDSSEMNRDCRTAVAACEGKLNQVKHLLPSTKPVTSVWVRKRPKKAYIDPGSVEDSFEDAFSPEDFVNLPNESYIEHCSPYSCQTHELFETAALKTRVEAPMNEKNIIHNVIVKENRDICLDQQKQSLDEGKCDMDRQNKNMVHGKQSLETNKGESETNCDINKVEKDNLNITKDICTENLEKIIQIQTKLDLEEMEISKTLVSESPIQTSKQIRNKISDSRGQNSAESVTSTDTSKTPASDGEIQTLKDTKSECSSSKDSESLTSKDISTEMTSRDEVDYIPTDKQQLISSCEDKLSKLKALLCKKKIDSEKSKPVDKHFKNPNRTLDKQKQTSIKQNIEEDILFATEIEIEPFVDESPVNSLSQTCLGEYFDEISGRFHMANLSRKLHKASISDSDDSFQIVFNDSPRVRLSSDCESEDSFIIFEDSPDSCYTSNDVFGESDEQSDSDTDGSELSDSGCSTLTCKLSHSLSRTVSNLTDDSLYEDGHVIDSSNIEKVMQCDELSTRNITDCNYTSCNMVSDSEVETDSDTIQDDVKVTGLIIDEVKKRKRRSLPVKKVHFSTEPPKVHLMRVWAFAARQARAGHWEKYAVDRDRFKRRIADVDMAVSWVLKPQHRSRVMFQRFMPWWNAQKRRELADKKKAEELRVRMEELRILQEELVIEEFERFKNVEDEEIRIRLEVGKVGCTNRQVKITNIQKVPINTHDDISKQIDLTNEQQKLTNTEEETINTKEKTINTDEETINTEEETLNKQKELTNRQEGISNRQ